MVALPRARFAALASLLLAFPCMRLKTGKVIGLAIQAQSKDDADNVTDGNDILESVANESFEVPELADLSDASKWGRRRNRRRRQYSFDDNFPEVTCNGNKAWVAGGGALGQERSGSYNYNTCLRECDNFHSKMLYFTYSSNRCYCITSPARMIEKQGDTACELRCFTRGEFRNAHTSAQYRTDSAASCQVKCWQAPESSCRGFSWVAQYGDCYLIQTWNGYTSGGSGERISGPRHCETPGVSAGNQGSSPYVPTSAR